MVVWARSSDAGVTLPETGPRKVSNTDTNTDPPNFFFTAGNVNTLLRGIRRGRVPFSTRAGVESLPNSGNPIRHDAGTEFHAFGDAYYFVFAD